MWAQMITARLKPGKESELPRLVEQLRSAEQAGSGLAAARDTMGEIFDGAPEFTDLTVIDDWTP